MHGRVELCNIYFGQEKFLLLLPFENVYYFSFQSPRFFIHLVKSQQETG